MTTSYFTQQLDSCIPPEVQQRRANGEDVDVDGWIRKRDLRDEALEDLRKQNGELRKQAEQKDAENARWTARIKELEKRLNRVAEIVEGKL
jgi:flagellar motility protein MotE (MotC chaperone)